MLLISVLYFMMLLLLQLLWISLYGLFKFIIGYKTMYPLGV